MVLDVSTLALTEVLDMFGPKQTAQKIGVDDREPDLVIGVRFRNLAEVQRPVLGNTVVSGGRDETSSGVQQDPNDPAAIVFDTDPVIVPTRTRWPNLTDDAPSVS